MKFVFLNANATEPLSAVARHAHEAGFTFPIYKDTGNAAADKFGATVTPETYVIDGKGILRYQGALDNDKTAKLTADKKPVTNYVLNAIKQIQAGETVSPDYTPSYGCHVNYVKKDSALYASGQDLFGNDYGAQTVDSLPKVPTNAWNTLSDVADTSFWSPYTH